jgi:hypothetical protein
MLLRTARKLLVGAVGETLVDYRSTMGPRAAYEEPETADLRLAVVRSLGGFAEAVGYGLPTLAYEISPA